MNKNAFSHIDVPDRGWYNSDRGADGWGYGVVEHGSDGGEFSAGAFGDSKHINNVFDEGGAGAREQSGIFALCESLERVSIL